jgi:hypothetical protein
LKGRSRAGCRTDYAEANPDEIAEGTIQDIGRKANFRDVETDGAARATALPTDLA